MQSQEWIALFRQFPKDVHNQLVVMFENRTEIMIDTLFRLEANFMVLRGRLGGTTEGGMLFVVPYDQMASVYLNRTIQEDEIDQLFAGTLANGVLKSSPSANGTATRPLGKSALRPSATPAAPAPAAPAPVQVVAPIMRSNDPSAVARNNLLERLRAARNAAMPPSAGGKQ